MKTLVLLRHGESEWNRENRLTGWTDVALTPRGVVEARDAGRLLLEHGQDFDVVHTSVLERATRTMLLALEEMDRLDLPVERTWRLNERHYGRLTGLDRDLAMDAGTDDDARPWWQSFRARPPAMADDDPDNPAADRRYDTLGPTERPRTESLDDTLDRVHAHWRNRVVPDLRAGKRVLIVAHGNSLGLLVKVLDGLSEEATLDLAIPTGTPLVYELGDDLTPARRFYLRETP